MVLQCGDYQTNVLDVFKVLLFVSFVANLHWDFGNLYVDEKLILFCSFLKKIVGLVDVFPCSAKVYNKLLSKLKYVTSTNFWENLFGKNMGF